MSKNRIAFVIALVVGMVLAYNALAATNESASVVQGAASKFHMSLEDIDKL